MTPREEMTARINKMELHARTMAKAWKTGDVKQFMISATMIEDIMEKAEEMLKNDIFKAYLKNTPLP